MVYDRLTRCLHAAIAIGVTLQMLASQLMIRPRPGRIPNTWWEIHEVLGVGLLVVLVAHWLWSIRRTVACGDPPRLFPWFSGRRLRALRDDTRRMASEFRAGRFPSADDEPRPAVAAIQGLGLLTATVLAATGTVVFCGMSPNGNMNSYTHAVQEVHGSVAPLMWAYLAIHPLAGIIHQFTGHPVVSRMFGWK